MRTKHTQPCLEVSYWLAGKTVAVHFPAAPYWASLLCYSDHRLSQVSKQIPRCSTLCLYNPPPPTSLSPLSHQRMWENNRPNKRSIEIITARRWSQRSYSLNHEYQWCEMGYVGDFTLSFLCFIVPTTVTCSYFHEFPMYMPEWI